MKKFLIRQYPESTTSIRHNTNFYQMVFGGLFVFLIFGHESQASEGKEIIKYRQNVMISQRAHMAAAAAIIKGKVNLDSQLIYHVKSMNSMNGLIPKLFPKGSETGDRKIKTKALDAIWNNNEEFIKRAKTAQEKSALLLKTVESGNRNDYGTALKATLKACKACHKDFRKKKKGKRKS